MWGFRGGSWEWEHCTGSMALLMAGKYSCFSQGRGDLHHLLHLPATTSPVPYPASFCKGCFQKMEIRRHRATQPGFIQLSAMARCARSQAGGMRHSGELPLNMMLVPRRGQDLSSYSCSVRRWVLKTIMSGSEDLLANSLNIVWRISSRPTCLKVSEDFLPLFLRLLPEPPPLCHMSWLCLQSACSWLEG